MKSSVNLSVNILSSLLPKSLSKASAKPRCNPPCICGDRGDLSVGVASLAGITGSAFASVSGLPAGYAVVYDNTLHQIRIEGTPPAAGYDAFADTITDVTKRGELDDADSDGISNLIEYAIAGNPNLPNRQILPAFAATATNAVFTFKRSDDSENDTTQIFQWSTDLQTWNDVALGAATAGIVSVVENESAADDITVTITKGTNTKIFGRVKIDKP